MTLSERRKAKKIYKYWTSVKIHMIADSYLNNSKSLNDVQNLAREMFDSIHEDISYGDFSVIDRVLEVVPIADKYDLVEVFKMQFTGRDKKEDVLLTLAKKAVREMEG